MLYSCGLTALERDEPGWDSPGCNPMDKGEASSEVKSFTSEDLERALAKQKEEHDASLEDYILVSQPEVLHKAKEHWCAHC